MSTDVHFDHEYRCDEATFWDRVFFEDDYNEGLYKVALRFPKYEKLAFEDRGATIFRRVKATPSQDAPGPIRSLMGGEFWYTEEATFDKASKRLRFKTIPSKLAEKIAIEGTIRSQPAGEAAIRRIADVAISVKIFGLGGTVEGFIAKQLKESFERGARFTNEWLVKKGLAK